MTLNYLTARLFFFLGLLLSPPVLCSEQPCARKGSDFELTPQSLSRFAAELASGFTDSLVEELQECHTSYLFRPQLLPRYLVGSVAVLGKVDQNALAAIRNICIAENCEFMTRNLDIFSEENNGDTVIRLIAKEVGRSDFNFNFFKHPVISLIESNWSAMEALVMRVLTILESDETQRDGYLAILKHLPIEIQYEMMITSRIPLDMIGSIYSFETFDPLLRGVFALARCSYNPSSQIREYIAGQKQYFKQFLPDSTVKSIVLPCPATIPTLSIDIWYYVSEFLDVETLLFVLPLVCVSWRGMHPKILTHSKRIHDFYLQDLSEISLSGMRKVAPWKYCLPNAVNALKYLGWCIVCGALKRARTNGMLRYATELYLEAITKCEIPFQKIKGCISQYESFLKLFRLVREFCAGSTEPRLDKPEFLTHDEYEQIIHHFVYEERWILLLSRSWIVNNIPSLFTLVREDEELMEKLIVKNFSNFLEPCIILVKYGQSHDIPERLARFTFSRAPIFKVFTEPKLVRPDRYYSLIVESDILPELAAEAYWAIRSNDILESIVFFLRDDLERIDSIVTSIIRRFPNSTDSRLTSAKCSLRMGLSGLLENNNSFLPTDVDFINAILAKLVIEE